MKHHFLEDHQGLPGIEELIKTDLEWLAQSEKDILRELGSIIAKATWISMYLGIKLNSTPLGAKAQLAAKNLSALQQAIDQSPQAPLTTSKPPASNTHRSWNLSTAHPQPQILTTPNPSIHQG